MLNKTELKTGLKFSTHWTFHFEIVVKHAINNIVLQKCRNGHFFQWVQTYILKRLITVSVGYFGCIQWVSEWWVHHLTLSTVTMQPLCRPLTNLSTTFDELLTISATHQDVIPQYKLNKPQQPATGTLNDKERTYYIFILEKRLKTNSTINILIKIIS